MIEKRFDDEWFIGYRGRLLEVFPYAVEERRPHRVHNLLHGAGLGGAMDRAIDAELSRLPRRHAAAVRSHMQFYRACLTATGLVPADALVRTAVQLEWFWYNTAFSAFYRDHIAHVMKVTAIGLSLLQDADSPLADGSEPLIDAVARDLAGGSLGSPAIRAAARRSGVCAEALADPRFWRYAVLETVRLAGLLHDMAHPAVIAAKMNRIAAPVRPSAAFEPAEEDMCRRAVAAFGHRLLAAPFHRGELPDVRGLEPSDVAACAAVFQHSHSLRGAYAIIRFAEEADRVWQLSPFDAFVMEWTALAVSLHDYDKLHALRASERPEDQPLRTWLHDDERNVQAIRPCYARDPVSYVLALADRLQEFGRVLGPMDGDTEGADRLSLSVRYPCRAVILRVAGAVAEIVVELGADDGTAFGATDWDTQRIREYKQREARQLFIPDGWLDSDGLLSGLSLEVIRRPARDRASLPGVPGRAQQVKLFYSFADKDDTFREALEHHLASLKWSGALDDWHHRRIEAGHEHQVQVNEHLEAADIVLLLVSADFIDSEYCFGGELTKALEMHRRAATRLVAVIVRPVDMIPGPLADLAVLPASGKAVSLWSNPDEAWADVARGIRRIVEEIRGTSIVEPGI